MARRSRMSVLKRQRELRKAEKAAQKRQKRHGGGGADDQFIEPRPTVSFAELLQAADPEASPDDADSDPATQAPSVKEQD